ncbi:MAG: ribonuclease Y [Christensenellaceae bacterium]|jgi:ribonuclease Y|nr:ribonuclease Y [Christensenellaceae bacterium]
MLLAFKDFAPGFFILWLVFLGLTVAAPFVTLAIYKIWKKKHALYSQDEADKILEDARQEAQTIRKDALLDAKEDQIKSRKEIEREVKERRAEMSVQENRLNQKEGSIDKKEAILDKKTEQLDKKLAVQEEANNQLEKRKLELYDQQKRLEEQEKGYQAKLEEQEKKAVKELERIGGLTKEDAKQELIAAISDEARRDSVKIVEAIEAEAKEEGDKKARNIVTLAVQRCAVDVVTETTTSTIEIPGEDMKGRIIGRTGRNIKSLESATGVDIIIDDTPEVITLSSFDPVRREIARLVIQKMLSDGRIHPGRIEELVEKTRGEMDKIVKEAGESAVFETGLYGIHPELVRTLGRLKYRTSYGQNVLKHSVEVSHLCGYLAAELGADVKLAKRAGLLHDIGKAIDHEFDGTHIQIGAELAKKYKESERVVHCIAAHHNDIEPQSVEAVIVQIADAISGARPGARRESLELYIKRLESLEKIAKGFSGVDSAFAVQAGREVRVLVKPEKVNDEQCALLAHDIARKLENDLEYPGQIKVNVIRETRKEDTAK